MKDRYVLLTGGKNNAGDFLIKKRAIALLQWLRPDREVIDLNAWEPFDPERTELVNSSRALLLTGGPALQEHMYSGVYALTSNLSDIRAPVIAFGIGWMGFPGDWAGTRDYALSPRTLELLSKIDGSGYLSSVRDYHTLNSLRHRGISRVSMTGCPALYVQQSLSGAPIAEYAPIRNVTISLGVSFQGSRRMERQMKSLIGEAVARFGSERVTVAFHHSLDERVVMAGTVGFRRRFGKQRFLSRHLQFKRWLDDRAIRSVDVSGSAGAMIDHYTSCDLHIGYRVHAHILMSSLSKRSLLITEDGRGRALRDVIGGPILDGFDDACDSLLCRFMMKLGIGDHFEVFPDLHEEVGYRIDQERVDGYLGTRKTRAVIDATFPAMRAFLEQLP